MKQTDALENNFERLLKRTTVVLKFKKICKITLVLKNQAMGIKSGAFLTPGLFGC
jgi:hypothetical protein